MLFVSSPPKRVLKQPNKGNKIQHDKISLDIHMLLLQCVNNDYLKGWDNL